ncbi:MAG: pseudouridine synthase, partial [Candidatus Anammoxibacter sp.]
MQKILAEAGFGSRRKCEELITKRKVEVDGEYVTSLGTSVDPKACKISCDGVSVKTEKKVYFLLNKPKGYICTNSDELGRPKAVDLFYNIAQRLYTVGRLDADTEGLIIVTNDGFIANKLAHPRFGITKTYMIEVQGRISTESLNLIRKGVWLAEGKLGDVIIRNIRKANKRSSFEMVLHEGKNREIRRMLAKVGHKVNLLRRISIGPIRLDPKIKVGTYKKIAKEKIYGLLDK